MEGWKAELAGWTLNKLPGELPPGMRSFVGWPRSNEEQNNLPYQTTLIMWGGPHWILSFRPRFPLWLLDTSGGRSLLRVRMHFAACRERLECVILPFSSAKGLEDEVRTHPFQFEWIGRSALHRKASSLTSPGKGGIKEGREEEGTSDLCMLFNSKERQTSLSIRLPRSDRSVILHPGFWEWQEEEGESKSMYRESL